MHSVQLHLKSMVFGIRTETWHLYYKKLTCYCYITHIVSLSSLEFHISLSSLSSLLFFIFLSTV